MKTCFATLSTAKAETGEMAHCLYCQGSGQQIILYLLDFSYLVGNKISLAWEKHRWMSVSSILEGELRHRLGKSEKDKDVSFLPSDQLTLFMYQWFLFQIKIWKRMDSEMRELTSRQKALNKNHQFLVLLGENGILRIWLRSFGAKDLVKSPNLRKFYLTFV